MTGFHYVYILVSEKDPARHYTGSTDNLEQRINTHNAGQSSHTAEHRPWRIETAVAFRSLEKAAAFERYLKSHSGGPSPPSISNPAFFRLLLLYPLFAF